MTNQMWRPIKWRPIKLTFDDQSKWRQLDEITVTGYMLVIQIRPIKSRLVGPRQQKKVILLDEITGYMLVIH